MELLLLLNKEAILCEKTPLSLKVEDEAFEYGEIEKFVNKSNISIEELQQGFELNRTGQLSDFMFEKQSKKVIAYQKIGLRYVSEVIFAFKLWQRQTKSNAQVIHELPASPKYTIEQSYEILKGFIIDKYQKGETDFFKLASYLLDEFYEFERANIEIDEAEQKELISEAGKWLKHQKESIMKIQGYSLHDILLASIDKRSAYSLAKRHVLAKLIIDNHLMDNL